MHSYLRIPLNIRKNFDNEEDGGFGSADAMQITAE